MNGKVVNQKHGDGYSVYQSDCIEGLKALPENSIHYSFFSPPFEALLVFSDMIEDMSNCRNTEEFKGHFRYFVQELHRVMMPGRLVSMHCCNLPTTVARHGFTGLQDFRGDLIRLMIGDAAALIPAIVALRQRQAEAMESGQNDRAKSIETAIQTIEKDMAVFSPTGFIFHSEVCIWKDPVIARARTNSIRLKHGDMAKDSANSGQGIPDIIITFRKPGKNPEPIAGNLKEYYGEFPPKGLKEIRDKFGNRYFKGDGKFKDSVNIWERYASPVWMDIDPGDVLKYRAWKGDKDERHISPTQLTPTRRCIQLYSNEGDTVLDSFGGGGTTGVIAKEMGRNYVGFDIKASYFEAQCRELEAVSSITQKELPLYA